VPASASYRAERTSARDQYGTSITRVYISSQSAILSLGANTGQFFGNGRYGRWSYQTGSCRHRLLYRPRHWSPGRACLSITTAGTPSCRSRAPSAIPPWPPPITTTYGSGAGSGRRPLASVWLTPFGRVSP
jgi:hypothetical protein